MDIWKVNEFNFLNDYVEEFTNRCSQNLVNARSLSYLERKTFEYLLWAIYLIKNLDITFKIA